MISSTTHVPTSLTHQPHVRASGDTERHGQTPPHAACPPRRPPWHRSGARPTVRGPQPRHVGHRTALRVGHGRAATPKQRWRSDRVTNTAAAAAAAAAAADRDPRRVHTTPVATTRAGAEAPDGNRHDTLVHADVRWGSAVDTAPHVRQSCAWIPAASRGRHRCREDLDETGRGDASDALPLVLQVRLAALGCFGEGRRGKFPMSASNRPFWLVQGESTGRVYSQLFHSAQLS